ncbi:MAG: hypothetical protein LBV40_01275 [Methanomicrobiales archaeon]|jgi:hypothetical protein|nr:hypothetical protein [Methanomicrobiales archaeon]
MGLKQIGIVVALILCCALVLPGAAAMIDLSPKRLYTGEKVTAVFDGTAVPVSLNSEFFISGASLSTIYYYRG